MRYFTDRRIHREDPKGPLCELLRALPADPDPSQPRSPLEAVFEPAATLEEADIAVLPYAWNEYDRRGETEAAIRWVRQAQALDVPVLTAVTGDFGVRPAVEDVHVFRASGYASRRLAHQHAMPFFLTDPLRRFFDADEPKRLAPSDRPRVGFCGQVSGSLLRHTLMTARTLGRNARFHLGLTRAEPQQVYPHLRLRDRALRALEQDSRIDTRFIRRPQYRAGARTQEQRDATTREYYDNIAESDYVLCLRGGGNFSVRLYETLAMGRIPVFVNTDCTLPFDEVLDWQSLMPWVEARDLETLPDVLASFHASMEADGIHEAQLRCRELWLERLTRDGFFRHLAELLDAPPWPQS